MQANIFNYLWVIRKLKRLVSIIISFLMNIHEEKRVGSDHGIQITMYLIQINILKP